MGHGCHKCGCPNGCECPRPSYTAKGLPLCSTDSCPAYDGKRCSIQGFSPGRVCEPKVEEFVEKLKTGQKLEGAPIPMRLVCPDCMALHIDEGEFATKPHHTHACQECGCVWRPAVVPTVGVRFLPGFRTEVPSE